MASQHAILVTDAQEEAYFENDFGDERISQEALAVLEEDEFLAASLPANDDLLDILEVSNDWADTQPDGFFIY